MQTVKHQSIQLDWFKSSPILNPKTLVLGSFNPYSVLENSVDYYYGRKTNHFWRTIARLLNKQEEYFFIGKDKLTKKNEVMNERFCCLDVIDSIDFFSDNQDLLRQFIENKIFTNFSDQTIWTTNTNFENKCKISLIRKYNFEIINLLKATSSIKKVIHTMGNNRINEKSINPKEKQLGNIGFSGFMTDIINVCNERNIEFIYNSYSPSDYAVKNGKTSKEDLDIFLKTHLSI